ncbi:SH3 domain-containing C40 family peptidase [Trinickia mobilis]|uniref:SH3 domain-containing C40 family peptidase n=1 Tax=Trinickia mobilis TaxID=2816356 RepID=UPI001A8CA824|nr:SH3 domain-containing C40 family peptidase [Trinickia mobilis]
MPFAVPVPFQTDTASSSSHRAAARAAAWLRLRIPAAILCAALAACGTTAPVSSGPAAEIDRVGLFPMAAYDQDVDHWIRPASPGYDTPFLSASDQQAQFEALYAREFGTAADSPSPWNPAFIDGRAYRNHGSDIAGLQQSRLARYDNTGKSAPLIGYGQNFRPYTKAWIDAIAQNMDVGQFERNTAYSASRRAIATGNLLVRELPTLDPFFYSRQVAGEGYPFDNLQISAIRPGTPLYVLGRSVDGGWDYVQTPDVQGWVRSGNVSFADHTFIDAWRRSARRGLGAVIAAQASVTDGGGTFRFDAPAGTLLPLSPLQLGARPKMRVVLVPARDLDGRAVIQTAALSDAQFVPMPYAATPRHLATLLKALIGRPYGWGNTGFYNDCSSELQSVFAAFGVWLPRHSSTQMSAGTEVDLSSSSTAERLDYLVHHGQPMRTLIYIGGHVMLYLGNTTRGTQTVPVVYQDIWGLRPADNSRRAVIGGSVIFPLLATMPEDPALQSLAGTPIFQVGILGAPQSGTPPEPDEDNPAS